MTQWLSGNLVATAMAWGIKNRLMDDNQYDCEIIRATENAIKTKKKEYL